MLRQPAADIREQEPGRASDLENGRWVARNAADDFGHRMGARGDVDEMIAAAGFLVKLGEFVGPARRRHVIGEDALAAAVEREVLAGPHRGLRAVGRIWQR